MIDSKWNTLMLSAKICTLDSDNFHFKLKSTFGKEYCTNHMDLIKME